MDGAADRPRRRPALRRQPFPPARAPQSRPLSAKSSTWNAAGELEPIRSSKGEIGHSGASRSARSMGWAARQPSSQMTITNFLRTSLPLHAALADDNGQFVLSAQLIVVNHPQLDRMRADS